MNLLRALIGKTDSLPAQVLRSLVVGGGAFIVDFSVLYALTEFGQIYYLASAAIAFLVGVTVNYSLSITWVFAQRSIANRTHEFILFALIGVTGLLLNLALMWFFTEALGLHYLNSKAVATILIFLFNFTTRRMTLFSAKEPGHAAHAITPDHTDNY